MMIFGFVKQKFHQGAVTGFLSIIKCMKLPAVYPELALTCDIHVHPCSSWESPIKDIYFAQQEYLVRVKNIQFLITKPFC